ncbi:hypothetical protein [Plebeiibacterium marinum]|uniref:Uncharacterized protein n=1 Tax=Plebeiibacterium marinum TaxID=2992111 RepID=A0AAE3MBH5_9BACT|nr:hypothetical protein [Plebeiobacterium marinum]MCW3804432.1 hypothetical protein [Plebeiobacterium marinum]
MVAVASFSGFRIKVKVIKFFGFLFFSGLSGLFVYYKLFGGVGFNMAAGFFPFTPGMINLFLLSIAFAVAFVGRKQMLVGQSVSFMVGVFLVLFLSGHILVWLGRIKEGLFIGGGVLNSMGVDDLVYFSIYYFSTFFMLLFALVLSVLYLFPIVKVKGPEKMEILFEAFKPLYLAEVMVFVLFYLWN